MERILRKLEEGVGASNFFDALSDASQDFILRIIRDNKIGMAKLGCTARPEAGDLWWWLVVYKDKKRIAQIGIVPSTRDVYGMCEFSINNPDNPTRDVHETKDAESVNLGYVGMRLMNFLSEHPALKGQ